MALFSRFRRRSRRPYAAVTDEERIARYVYLLQTLPPSVIESAHASAFADLPPERRREMLDRLRPFMAEGERDGVADDPVLLSRLLRRAEEHRAKRAAEGTSNAASAARTAVDEADPRDGIDPRTLLLQTGALALVANQVLLSAAVTTYFTAGAGSLAIDGEPAWVGATYDPVGTGWESGGGSMDGGFEASGFDGGGLGGGFDGGGFGF